MTNTANLSKKLTDESIAALRAAEEISPGLWVTTRKRGSVTQAGLIGLHDSGLATLVGDTVGGFHQAVLNESGVRARRHLDSAHCVGCGIALYRMAPHAVDCVQRP